MHYYVVIGLDLLHCQVLKDRERLVKRTQLKRSVYRVLGTDSEAAVTGNENGTGTDSKAAVAGNENGTGTDSEAAVTGNEKGTNRKTEGDLTDKDRDGPDTHLRDCDPEIFDDDDFYHQVYIYTMHIFCIYTVCGWACKNIEQTMYMHLYLYDIPNYTLLVVS